jgi:hypothetical protein
MSTGSKNLGATLSSFKDNSTEMGQTNPDIAKPDISSAIRRFEL